MGHFIDSFIIGNDPSSHCGRALFVFIYSFHIPLFFFISGLFVKPADDKSSAPTHRIVSLFILGFALKILYSFLYFALGNGAFFSLLSDGGIPWFLFALGAYYFFAWLFRTFDKKLIMVFSLMMGLVVGYDSSVGDQLYLSRIVVFFPFFWLGYCFDPRSVAKLLSTKWLTLLSAAILVGFALICFTYTDHMYTYRLLFTGRNPFSAVDIINCGWIDRLKAYTMSAALSGAVLCLMPSKKIPFISVAGSRTLQIYFWHFLATNLVSVLPLIPFLMEATPLWPILVIVLALLTSALLAFEPLGKPLQLFLKKSTPPQTLSKSNNVG